MGNTALKYEEERHWTYADYREWDLAEGERYEIIRGTAYALAAPTDYHQAISAELTVQIGTFLHGKPCKVRAAPYDVRLFYDEADGEDQDDTVVQPDLVVICDDKKRGSEGCRGAPDLVIEILSPSNTSEEFLRKFNLYMDAGVREYWVVDPVHKMVMVNLFENGRCITRMYRQHDTVPAAVLPGLTVTLRDVFA